MKRLLVVLLIALFCFSLLAGCAPKKEEAQEEVQTEEIQMEKTAEDVQTEQAEEAPAEEAGE